MRSRRTTLFAGGIGLIACGVIGVLRAGFIGGPGAVAVGAISDLTYAAAVFVFAIGLSREASVVARKPLGLGAMIVVALWPLTGYLLGPLLDAQQAAAAAAWMVYGYVGLAVPVGAALVAAVQIARAGTVPARWRWAPLGALCVQVAAWVIPQAAMVGLGTADAQALATLFATLATVGFLAGSLGLGILALVAAEQERPESVQVYRSPS